MKIVILDRVAIGLDTPLEILSSFGDVTTYLTSTPEEAIERARDAEILITNKIKVTRELLAGASRLKLVCVFATGFDNIDVAAAREFKVAVCNVPGYSTDSVVLYTISTTLALCSHLYEYNSFVKSGEYTDSGVANRLEPVYHDIRGKVWGIVGYGNIGRAVADVARALGAEVIVNKRHPIDCVRCVDIDTLCRESDIITLHCPLNDNSRGLISKERIELMKRGVVLVNEARGAVVDEEAVACAVEQGKIAAYGCDVYSTEPFDTAHPYNRIMNYKNVILTPHCAWGSYESRERCIKIIAENITAFVEGKVLNRVDI